MSELKKKILERTGFRIYVRKVMSGVKKLLAEDGGENIYVKLVSIKINLEKQQQEIESLDQQIAQMLEADAIEKEILDRCEFEASLQETISLISSHLSFKESKNSEEHMQSTGSLSPLSMSQQDACWGSTDGAVVEHLSPTQASHQCGLGSIPGLGVICGLSLLLVLVLAPRGFSPGTPVFPSPQKPTFPNSN